jgi:hypothetical protein
VIANMLEHCFSYPSAKPEGQILLYTLEKTEAIFAELYCGNNGYKFSLEPTCDSSMVFKREVLCWNMSSDVGVRSEHYAS